mmetsp:Transcript_21140/g.29874  ORF Transcript_21140/g.29874 Transcript_21140/m.29874 type:complete len:518 (-) Transcript_21140:251-1804(-)
MVTQDEFFCHEIAKRSVARAALHLGVEYMSEEVLEVMGDVLLSYLAKVGRTISMAVESSGRTSAHVHVLDAIRAAESCTSPAVHRLHMMSAVATQGGTDAASTTANGGAAAAAVAATGGAGSNANGVSAASSLTRLGNTWQDLAVFCFGPDWKEQAIKEQQQQQKEQYSQQQQQIQASPNQVLPAQAGAGGGKNILAHGMNGDSSTLAKEKQQKQGWDVPYLDEVPEFPIASSACANPHRLSADVALSLHNLTDADQEDGDGTTNKAKEEEEFVEQELQGMPDDAFANSTFSWGELDVSKKRSREDDVINGSGSNKRARVDSAKATSENKDSSKAGADEQEKENKEKDASSSTKNISFAADQSKSKSTQQQQQKRPAYIPHFYPPFPQAKTSLLGRAIVDMDGGDGIYAKLNHRMKSSFLASHTGAVSVDGAGSSNVDDTSVPLGVRSSLVKLGQEGGYWGSEWDTGSSTTKTDTLAVPFGRSRDSQPKRPAVEPLTKASGSRVSRIIEGSLDTAAK